MPANIFLKSSHLRRNSIPLIRHLNQGVAPNFKFGTTESPRALASSGAFESLDNYFSKNATSYTISKEKLENSLGDKLATQAIPTSKFSQEMEDQAFSELPKTNSHFRMTKELFQAAKQAEPGSAASFWSHRLYRGPDVDGTPSRPTVHYCRSSSSTEKVLQSHFMDRKVIGFDIEWRADALKFHGPRANVSLIQIADEERIGLFHIALYPQGDTLVPPSLRKILEDPTVSKVGVSIKSDCTRIRKHLNIECRGLFELSHLFKLVKFSQNKDFGSIDKKLVSLAKQVQEHFYLPLFKGGDVRNSDWSNKLQLHQMVYAAADSYAAIQLYHTLEMKRNSLNPTPPRPHHAELNIPIPFIKDTEDTTIHTDKSQSGHMKKAPITNSLTIKTRQRTNTNLTKEKMKIIEKSSSSAENVSFGSDVIQKGLAKKDSESRQLIKDAVGLREGPKGSHLDSESPFPRHMRTDQESIVAHETIISSNSKIENTRIPSDTNLSVNFSRMKQSPEVQNIPNKDTSYIGRAISSLPNLMSQYLSRYLK
ncbi:hypothetical protein OnM2_045089 [Erysiphe neolycopersici]|uniref:3'-5' exonuclease domain-containing protein n=1 Tax=Erysiphe neolycopersici TaxID=212602 RepID=A0A420HUD2_9PEZI|nr:hypothetical protein OnM2_045089 [Erysiphe neolycopersici]